ncbi:MAG: peptidase M48 [Acidobacteria bacterium]|nr:MAG: peptidase M48 [Acidobacteriota bacterium]
MIHKVARTGLVLFLAIVVATPFPLLAQNDSSNQTKTSSKDEDKDKSKSKSKSKKKNSDVENIGNRNINKGSINFFSLEKEIQMGRQLAAEIERQVKLVEDPTINEYVNRVGQNIVRNSDAKVPFTIKVVESDEINAFALPGGFFYVNSGLILAADDESELAAVMAHEIAHVAARHGTKQASKAELINFASIPLIFMGGVGGFALRQAAGFLIPLQFLQFSRGDEAEADYLGLQYLYKTGYDPGAAVSFFEKLQAKESAKPGSVSKMFSTHPPTGDRIEMTKKNIEQILPDKEQYVVTTSEFNKVRTLLAQLENRRPSQEDANKPSLRRKTQRPDVNGDDDKGGNPKDTSSRNKKDKDKDKDAKADSTKPDDKEPADDDRPKLKRRD